MHRQREVIREHLTPEQVLLIRQEAKQEGCYVNVTRLLSGLVEIEIIRPDPLITVNDRLKLIDR